MKTKVCSYRILHTLDSQSGRWNPDVFDVGRYKKNIRLSHQRIFLLASLEEVVVIVVGSVCECYILTKRKKKERRGVIYESSGFLFCLYSCSFLSDATLLKCALCVCVLERRGLEPAEPGQRGWSSENASARWWYHRAFQAFGRTNYRAIPVANEHFTGKTFFQWNT